MHNFKIILLLIVCFSTLNSCTPEVISEEAKITSDHITSDTGDQDDEPEHRNGG